MTPKETALILRLHNAWRRGDDETSPNMTPPKLLGEAIDSAIALIEQRDELLALLVEFSDALPSDEYMASQGSTPGPLLQRIRAAIANAKEKGK